MVLLYHEVSNHHYRLLVSSLLHCITPQPLMRSLLLFAGVASAIAPPVPGYTQDFLNNVAVNVPLDCESRDTYITYKSFPVSEPLDSPRCAQACKDETRGLCRFFNIYQVDKNGQPHEQICSLYTEIGKATYAQNAGQYRGDDRYTVRDSWAFASVPESSVCAAATTSSSAVP